MVIGICGKSGCGKSTFARTLAKKYENSYLCDIDKIGHNVLTIDEVKKDLVNAFGSSVLKDGTVDRKTLGKIVFSSYEEMEKLNDITWKHMCIQLDNILEKNSDKLVILDWALLPKTKYFNMCDITILLDVPYEIRKERAMLRDSITEEAFDLRESASLDYDNYDFSFTISDNSNENIKKVVRMI